MSLPDFALHSACASSPAPAAALQRAGSQVGGAVTALADLQAEHAACGVGWVASLRAEASHGVVQDALTVLKRLAHRGAVGSDPLTGDGAGILTQVPHALFAAESAKLHFTLPPPGRYAVGMFFLPKDPDFAARSEELAADVLQSLELKVLGWRTVPIDRHQCGVLGLQSMPTIRQLFLSQGQQRLDAAAFERLLYLARKRMERLGKVLGNGARAPFYVCSLSARTLVYKGLLLPDRLAAFYPDLSDPRYHSALAIVHQRFSTNTFPSWQRAHPYRYVAHNGEFNTLRGNVNWMKARERVLQSALFGDVVQELKPVIDEHGSDSAIFDNVLELLVQTGRSLPHAAVMMVPEAWQRHRTMSASKRAFYEYHAACMEPWDGPACIAFSDGRLIGSVLDRNGLRPSRYLITQDGRIIVASEAGVLDVPAAQIQSRGRLSPGRMLLVDTAKGRLISDDEIKESLAARQPYADWLKAHRVALEALPASRLDDLPRPLTGEALVAHQRAAAYSREDLYTLLVPMAQSGKEPIGAMGDDTPLAVLSAQAEPLFHYFKQRFAQVTNPPIDPIREELVMSLRTNLGPAANLFEETAAQCHQLTLDGPILTGERLHQIRILQRGRLKSAVVPCHYPPGEAEQGLLRGLASLEQRAEQAVRQGATILVLSDRGLSPERAMIPCLLAVAAVHHHLIRAGLRQQVGLVVETAEAREVMHVCLLIGYGAGAVHPYLAYDSLAALHQEGAFAGLDLATVLERYIQALHKGILKVLSKMGISTLQSYRGAQIFEAVGIHPRLIERYFPGTPSRLGGVGLSEIAQDSLAHHAAAWNRERQLPMPLPVGGRYKWRRDGQARQYTPSVVAQLQHAVRSADRALFARYCAGVEEESARARTLRSLLLPLAARPIPLAEVEPARDIAKRFKTGAMSFGSLSPEAHENLAVAMNRLGGRSNSGEGGEDPRRYPPDAQGDSRRSAIKQVASGRFGVTSHYLVEANELQIKIAQGAKPGEGGQLPGHKVVGDIARIRFATPGVGLISPPPHHDIYSIEDLAELIYDLRKANDRARISVKLVSQSGVGTVAAGVAKAGADTILISGHSGGTGASPLSSIKHVGLPWEMGLAETQQVLVHNDLRGRVRLESDGQLKTPRDVFIAALLGAEEFGFGTAALVASGCVLMRVCHLNTCPVGVATQDPVLRARFAGTPEHVMNFFVFLAEGLRQLMAEHGFASVDAMVGRVDRLRPHPHLQDHPKLRTLDLAPLLHQGLAPPSVARRSMRREPHPVPPGLDHTLLELAGPAIDEGLEVKATLAIGNADRAVGTQLSAELSRRWGGAGLHKGHCHFTFQGSAGQSFGAFLTAGLRFDLEGEANDSVGKGLCGGLIVLRPPTGANFAAGEHTLLGNVALYGATGGALFAAGMAGERFAVRNSGATAVVEGVGDHGCEYMTRGIVVVLGPTGRNFAAGMSGGLAYVLDADGGFGIRCNLGLVELAAPTADNVSELAALIRRHASLTGSQKAQAVLADWPRAARDFVVVAPRTQPQASPAAVQAVAHAQAR